MTAIEKVLFLPFSYPSSWWNPPPAPVPCLSGFAKSVNRKKYLRNSRKEQIMQPPKYSVSRSRRSGQNVPFRKESLRTGASTLGTLLAVVVILAGTAGAGAWWWTSAEDGNDITNAILHEVKRDEFVLNVIERGEILSSGVTEIRSLVKSKNTTGTAILRIVPEGTEVKEGDFLVELDSSVLNEELISQQVLCNTAQAAVIEAKNLYETALIAKQEYLEGTYVQERQTIESEVFVAEENLNRAKEYFEYSKKLAAKGYVNELQLEADRFAVEKSEKELDAARTKLKVLDEFTKTKTVKQLESDILIAKAQWEAQKNSYELELEKLNDTKDQIAKCMILAPSDGTVMYAHERDRRGNEDFIVEEGAVVRERQPIIKLPDPSSMQVEISVNESLVQFVKKEMPAKIAPVGMGDVVLKGLVKTVNQYAEPSGWRKANVKDYKAFVEIEETVPELRPGMTAAVTIQCAYLPNVIEVPIQAVYAHGKDFYSFTYGEQGWNAVRVECGPTNDKFIVIHEGLEEGDLVVLNPRSHLDKVNLPDLPPEQQQRAVPQEEFVPLEEQSLEQTDQRTTEGSEAVS